LKTGGVSVARTVVNDKVVTELTVTSVTPSVAASEKVEILFNATLANLGSTEALVAVYTDTNKTKEIPVSVTYSTNKIEITPKSPWKSGGRQSFVVELNGLSSEKGARLTKTYTSEPIFVRDADREDFEITNFEVDGQIWLRDSAEAIVLEFSKDIDTAKLTAVSFLNVGHKVEIDGDKLTLTPPQGKWVDPSSLTLTVASFEALKAIDGSSFVKPTGSKATNWNKIGWGLVVKDPFVLLTKDTTLRGIDSLAPITLDFTFAFDTTDTKYAPVYRIVRAAPTGPALSAGKYTNKSYAKAAAKNEPAGPEVAVSGAKVTITPLIPWADWNAIVVYGSSGLRSVNDVTLHADSAFVLYVEKTQSGTFSTLESKVVTPSSSTSPIRFTFTDAVDTLRWTRNDIILDPAQPFELSFDKLGTVVVLTPLGDYKWRGGTQTPPSPASALTDGLKVSFKAELSSLDGKKLDVGTDNAGQPNTSFDRWIDFIGVTGDKLTDKDAIEWAAYDSMITDHGTFAKTGAASFQLAWKSVPAADGYRLWYYEGSGSKASTPVVKWNTDLTGSSTPGTGYRVDGKGTSRVDGDTLVYALGLGAGGAADTIKDLTYELVVQPVKGSGTTVTSVGPEQRLIVTPGFTFLSSTRQNNITPAVGAVTSGNQNGTFKITATSFVDAIKTKAANVNNTQSENIVGTTVKITFNQALPINPSARARVGSSVAGLTEVISAVIIPNSQGDDRNVLEVQFRYNFVKKGGDGADKDDPKTVETSVWTASDDVTLIIDNLESESGGAFFDVSGTHPDKNYLKSITIWGNATP
jgi:hypothetical protein